MEKWLIPIFEEMFRMVGEVFTEEYCKQDRWYTLHSWTQTEEARFETWLYRYLRKRNPWKHMTQKRMMSEVGYFMLMYSWKTKEGNDGDKDMGRNQAAGIGAL